MCIETAGQAHRSVLAHPRCGLMSASSVGSACRLCPRMSVLLFCLPSLHPFLGCSVLHGHSSLRLGPDSTRVSVFCMSSLLIILALSSRLGHSSSNSAKRLPLESCRLRVSGLEAALLLLQSLTQRRVGSAHRYLALPQLFYFLFFWLWHSWPPYGPSIHPHVL